MSVGNARASLLIEVKLTSTVSDAFARAIADIAHDAQFSGVEIVQHAAHRGRNSTQLTVTIDREGGVDLETCERIAGRINRELDLFEEKYTLNVESAGLSRPLVKPGDFERFTGRKVKIVTSLAIHGAKTHRGVLRGVRGTNVILETPAGELPLPLATVEKANLEYDAQTDLQQDKRKRKTMHNEANNT